MRISRKPTGARFFELFAEIGTNIGADIAKGWVLTLPASAVVAAAAYGVVALL